MVVLAAAFSFGWDALVAIGTIGLAAGTFWLAYLTRKLATASRDDERSQWRPVLVPGEQPKVNYNPDTGDLSFVVMNLGRGPAMGLGAQLRWNKAPVGSSTASESEPNTVALAPGAKATLRCRLSDGHRELYGRVVTAEINYYDITERWHQSVFTISGYHAGGPPGSGSAPAYQIANAFVQETDRVVLPVLGSPTAQARAAESRRRPWGKRIEAAWAALRGN